MENIKHIAKGVGILGVATVWMFPGIARADDFIETFTQYTSLEKVNNFATDDLVQGLKPDDAGGLNERGKYINDLSAGDAKADIDPGSATPNFSLVWYEMPAYLIYTLPDPCDITEIRLTAIPASGDDRPGDSHTADTTQGDICLGVPKNTNPEGKPPIRPEENAIEVMFEGENIWTPIVPGRVCSGPRTIPKGVWQGVWKFPGNGIMHVRRLRIVLGPTSTWGSYGRLMRLAEADVIGKATTSSSKITAKTGFISASHPGIELKGFLGAVPGGREMTWSGSGFDVRFKSNRCRLRFRSSSKSQYWIKIDGGSYKQVTVQPIVDLTSMLTDNSEKEHRLSLIKKSEPGSGTDVFSGMDLDSDNCIIPMLKSESKKILFLGDSITVGSQTPESGQTDVMSTYAWMIRDYYDADIRIVAQSGVGVFKGWRTTPFLQDWNLVMEVENQTTATAGTRWQPDLIVINLGTNDSSKGVKNEDYIRAMKELITSAAKYYSNSKILVMVPWTYGCYRNDLESLVQNLKTEIPGGIYFADTDKQTWVPENGMSDNTHPNLAGHKVAADKLIPIIEGITHWSKLQKSVLKK